MYICITLRRCCCASQVYWSKKIMEREGVRAAMHGILHYTEALENHGEEIRVVTSTKLAFADPARMLYLATGHASESQSTSYHSLCINRRLSWTPIPPTHLKSSALPEKAGPHPRSPLYRHHSTRGYTETIADNGNIASTTSQQSDSTYTNDLYTDV